MYRKSLLLLISLLFMAASATAQFRWGPTAGVNHTNLNFKQDLVTVDPTTNFSAGLQTEMMFPGVGFGISFGLLYEQMGAKIALGEKKIWASQGYGLERSYLHYIEIPFFLRYKCVTLSGLEEKIAPLVYGGPTFDFLVAHNKIDAFDYAGGVVGLSVGGGFELFRRFQITATYTWGMTYALKTKLLSNYSARPRTLDIRLTYFLK